MIYNKQDVCTHEIYKYIKKKLKRKERCRMVWRGRLLRKMEQSNPMYIGSPSKRHKHIHARKSDFAENEQDDDEWMNEKKEDYLE